MFEIPVLTQVLTQCTNCGHVASICSTCGHDVSKHTKNPKFNLTCFYKDKNRKTCPCTEKFLITNNS